MFTFDEIFRMKDAHIVYAIFWKIMLEFVS